MIDLVGDIEGDLATLLREMDVDGDLAKLLAELDVLEQRDGMRTHVSVGDHRKAISDAMEAHNAEMIAAISQTIETLTQSIMQAMMTPRLIVRDPETNMIEGSRPATPIDISPGGDPVQLASASPAARALYENLLRLAQVVAEGIGRPKRVGRGQDGRPFIIQ